MRQVPFQRVPPLGPDKTGRLLNFMDPDIRQQLTPEQRAEVAQTVIKAMECDPRVLDELYMNRLDLERKGLRWIAARLGWRFKLVFGLVILNLFVKGDRRWPNRLVDRGFALIVLTIFLAGAFILAYVFKSKVLHWNLFPDWHFTDWLK